MKADKFLENKGLDFERIEQDRPTTGCEEAAAARGLETCQIVKSLIVERNGTTFHICVPGDRNLSEKKFGEHRLVDPEKSRRITGQESGTVHPFSSELEHVVDERVLEQEQLSFTLGTRTEAVKISSEQFRSALEEAGFDYRVEDIVVSTDEDVEKLETKGLERKNAKFIVENGYRSIFGELQGDFPQSQVMKLLLEFNRHELQVSENLASEILERADNQNHLQKMIEHYRKNGELPDTQEFDIEEVVEKVVDSNKEAVEDFREGNESSVNYLVGQVMKRSKGKADPETAREKIIEQISR